MLDDGSSGDDSFGDYDNSDDGSSEESQNGYYEVLSNHKVLKFMNKEIEEVSNMLIISKTTTRLLLNRLNWNKFELTERFFTDEHALFRDTKVVKTLLQSEVMLNKACNCTECQICTDSFPLFDLVGHECGHKFCVACWNAYLTNKILAGGTEEGIPCAAYNCSVLVEDEMCMTLLKNYRAIEVYERIIIDSFVECSDTLRWCPNATCRNVIRMDFEAIKYKPVSCYCASKRFCFSCSQNWHVPIKCSLLEKWTKLIDPNNIECFKWIHNYTKKCPTCGVHIERTGGCNTMHCRKCMNYFCWICMDTLTKPKNINVVHCYKCIGIPLEQTAKRRDDNQTDSSNNGPKYALLFYTSFMKNKELLEADKILRERTNARTLELAKQGIPFTTRNILEDAPDILVQCRQMAMYSYVFEFFYAENEHIAVFKQNQTSLLDAIETLSEVLKNSIESEFLDYNLQLQNSAKSCKTIGKTLENHIYEGYKKSWFEFKPDVF